MPVTFMLSIVILEPAIEKDKESPFDKFCFLESIILFPATLVTVGKPIMLYDASAIGTKAYTNLARAITG